MNKKQKDNSRQTSIENFKKDRKKRNWIILSILIVLIAIFYFLTIDRLLN